MGQYKRRDGYVTYREPRPGPQLTLHVVTRAWVDARGAQRQDVVFSGPKKACNQYWVRLSEADRKTHKVWDTGEK